MYNGSLSRKRIITDANGNKIVDICAPTVSYKDLVNLTDKFHMVSEDEAMRLDKIADTYYADVEKLDAILWRNNIYNPFSMEALDIINIPYAKDTEVFYKNPPVQELPDGGSGTSSQISSASGKLNKTVSANGLREGRTAKTVSGSNIVLGTHLRNE